MEDKKIWLGLAVVILLYFVFKEEKPSPVPTPSYSYDRTYPRTFHGRTCLDDCSGHEAGYQWAEDHNIDDEDDCTGYSQSFIEGCIAFVEENN